jgi:frataxin
MDESLYHQLADAFLAHLNDLIDEQDAKGLLDAELSGGVLTIEIPGGKQFVVSKHAPSKQVWLSSPISGGLHFSAAADEWKLADGRKLNAILASEIQQLSSVTLSL